MNYTELQALKAGDPVGICPAYGGDYQPWKTHNVLKVTATQITLSNDERFLRRNGRALGGGPYHAPFIVSLEEVETHNEHIKLKVERDKTIQRMENALVWLKNGNIDYKQASHYISSLEALYVK